VSEGLDSIKDVESWLGEGGAAWRLMALRWFYPGAIKAEHYKDAIEAEPLKSILDQIAPNIDSGGKSRFYREKYKGLAWRLQLMADFGVNKEISKVREAVDNYFAWSLSPEGGLSHAKGLPAFPCILGMMLNSFAKLGYDENDERIKAIADYIAGEIRPDGGWLCPPRIQDIVVNETHSCFTSTYQATSGLVALNSKNEKQKNACKSGLEFMLNHRLFRSDRSNRVLCARWLDIGYPIFNYYSVLNGANLIAAAGYADDERCDEALAHLQSSRQDDGSWLQGWVPLQPKPYVCTERGKSCRALTIITWSTLVNAGRLSPPQIN